VTVYQAADGTFNAHCFSCGDDCQSTDEHGVPLALSKANGKGAPTTAPTATQTTAAPAAPLDDVPPFADYEDYPMPDDYDTAPHPMADASEGSEPASFDAPVGDVPNAIDIADIKKLPHVDLRGISAETMERFHIYAEMDQVTGAPRYLYTADYARGKATGTYERRDLVNKGFIGVGDRKRRLDLWGLDSASELAHTVYITEGVFDAMAGYEIIEQAYPGRKHGVAFVSLVKGAASIERALDDNEGVLRRDFDIYIPAFDDDAPGSNARDAFMDRFPNSPDVDYPEGCKDLNDVLRKFAGDEEGLRSYADYLLGGGNTDMDNFIHGVDSMVESLCRAKGKMYSTPWPALNAMTGGVEEGTVTIVGAAPKVGKTTFNYNLIHHLITVEGVKVGLFDLESTTGRSATRLASVAAGKSFNKVGDDVDNSEEIAKWVQQFKGSLFAFDPHRGATGWDTVRPAISRMVYRHGVKVFILDPLTVLSAGMGASSANAFLTGLAKELEDFAKKHRVAFICYSHVRSRPTGREDSYEMGAFPNADEYANSRAFSQAADIGLSLARHTVNTPSHMENVIGIRVTLNRTYGILKELWCKFDPETERLVELPDGKPVEVDEVREAEARKRWEEERKEVVEQVLDPKGKLEKKRGIVRMAALKEKY